MSMLFIEYFQLESYSFLALQKSIDYPCSQTPVGIFIITGEGKVDFLVPELEFC